MRKVAVDGCWGMLSRDGSGRAREGEGWQWIDGVQTRCSLDLHSRSTAASHVVSPALSFHVVPSHCDVLGQPLSPTFLFGLCLQYNARATCGELRGWTTELTACRHCDLHSQTRQTQYSDGGHWRHHHQRSLHDQRGDAARLANGHWAKCGKPHSGPQSPKLEWSRHGWPLAALQAAPSVPPPCTAEKCRVDFFVIAILTVA